jgi:hypothetical protein
LHENELGVEASLCASLSFLHHHLLLLHLLLLLAQSMDLLPVLPAAVIRSCVFQDGLDMIFL